MDLSTQALEASSELYLSDAVMLIVYMRDNFPQEDCQLDDTGSDVVEDFWSKNGQWVGNHHNYTFGELRRNTSHMIRLEEIRVDPSAPDFAKQHPKQESIWGQQYERPINVANLKEYPAIGTEIEAWKEGIKIARGLARSVGMIPDIDAIDEDNNDDGNDDNDGHDGSEGDDGCLDNNVRGRNHTMKGMQVVKIIGFTVPLNAWKIHFVPTRMKTMETTAARQLLLTKTTSVMEVQPFQVRQQFFSTAGRKSALNRC